MLKVIFLNNESNALLFRLNANNDHKFKNLKRETMSLAYIHYPHMERAIVRCLETFHE